MVSDRPDTRGCTNISQTPPQYYVMRTLPTLLLFKIFHGLQNDITINRVYYTFCSSNCLRKCVYFVQFVSHT